MALALASAIGLLSGFKPVQAEGKSKSLIRKIDFRNFTYPSFWSKERIKVKNGKLETRAEHCMNEYSIKGVTYLDFTNDGVEEALVHMTDFEACGSSGVADYYYVYGMRNGRLRLLWRFSTGSEGICGLKDLRIEKKELAFEFYGNCRIRGVKFSLANSGDPECCPAKYSKVRVAWNGRRFVQKSAQTFPFPYESVNAYEATRRRE